MPSAEQSGAVLLLQNLVGEFVKDLGEQVRDYLDRRNDRVTEGDSRRLLPQRGGSVAMASDQSVIALPTAS